MFVKCIIIALVATTAYSRTPADITNQNSVHSETTRSQESFSYLGDLRYLYKVYQECSQSDLSVCLKLKIVSTIDRVARTFEDVPIFGGVSFVKNPKVQSVEKKSEKEIESALPRSLIERDEALNNMIMERVSNFFETHTLQVKLPTSADLQRSFTEEARKKKKGGAMMLLPLVLGGTMIPLALGALALLAGKALIVSKLALVLAGIIGLKKLLSGGGHTSGHESGHDVVVNSHGSGWSRSYEDNDAQNLAYKAYGPTKK